MSQSGSLDQICEQLGIVPRYRDHAGAVREVPEATLRSLVFGGNTQTITNAISNASGVKPSTAASLFSVALPTVLGYLSRLVTRENLDAAGLGRRLATERTPLIAVLPAGLGSLLSTSDDRTGVHAAVDTSHGKHVPYPKAGVEESALKGPGAWITAAVLGLFALGALYALLGRSPSGPAGTPGAIGTAGYVARVLPDGPPLRFPAGSTEARFREFIVSIAPVARETAPPGFRLRNVRRRSR